MKNKNLLFIGILLGTLLVGCNSSVTDNVNKTQTTEQISTQFDNVNETENNPIIYEYTADLTHDGNDEVVKVIIDLTNELEVAKVQVYENDTIIYEDELYTNYALGSQYYLVSHNEKDYLMQYNPLIDHDIASVSYEIFSLNENGEKLVFDESYIEISLFNVADLNKESWIAFANKENSYFQNAFLLISTSEGIMDYSKTDSTIQYTEQFLWLLNEDIKGNIDDILETFIIKTQEIYN